jgi:hypothetical protein
MRSLAEGVRVALATPSHIDHRLPELLEPCQQTARGESHPDLAIRAAHRTLRYLARIPGSRWRNTCLYRSVAECVLLRAHGIAARLCIGVEPQDNSASGVGAHAWVESPSDVQRSAPPGASMVRLAGSSPRRPDAG